MSSLAKNWVSIVIATSAIVAASSVVYYTMVYVPMRDRAATEAHQAEVAAQEERSRQALREQAETQRKEQADLAIRTSRRTACREEAEAAYTSAWNAKYVRQAQYNKAKMGGCLSRSSNSLLRGGSGLPCSDMYGDDRKSGCALPSGVADSLNESFKRTELLCDREFDSPVDASQIQEHNVNDEARERNTWGMPPVPSPTPSTN